MVSVYRINFQTLTYDNLCWRFDTQEEEEEEEEKEEEEEEEKEKE